jgi:hypothetical protein
VTVPGDGQVDPSGVALATLMAEHTPLLHSILAELRADVIDLGVSDAQGREMMLEQFPVAGSKRVLVYRTGNGTDGLAVPTTGVLVFPANEARLGLTLINTGANAVILYLTDQRKAGSPAVWLAAAGGAWDGRIGNLSWAGNVFAVAQVGASTLVGGEL